MKTVQMAIHDPEYANSIRVLLSKDGSHRVHVVDKPDVSLEGVIVVEAAELDALPALSREKKRLVVLVRKEGDDLCKIWRAGVQHVFFHGDTPHAARVVVLGVELSLACCAVTSTAQFDPLGF
jgi:hypothetical protein